MTNWRSPVSAGHKNRVQGSIDQRLDTDATARSTVDQVVTAATIGIGEAARALGTTPRALRYYEGRGLLHPAGHTFGGHRRYDNQTVTRARRLLALRALGLSLTDVGGVLDGTDTAQVTTILHAQASRLSDEIAQLHALHKRVVSMLTPASSHPTPLPTPGPLLDLLEDLAMNVRLSSIYTKTGDEGMTDLAGGIRVDKKDPRLEVGGDLDELISAIGFALATPNPEHVTLLRQIQNDLFDLGARVATDTGGASLDPASYTARLERACDDINAQLQPADSFVLPGGSAFTAALHLARAICRRAERHAWALTDIDREICRYLNRLSDLLFILARSAEPATEPTWSPDASKE